jgi:hypothetical protein
VAGKRRSFYGYVLRINIHIDTSCINKVAQNVYIVKQMIVGSHSPRAGLYKRHSAPFVMNVHVAPDALAPIPRPLARSLHAQALRKLNVSPENNAMLKPHRHRTQEETVWVVPATANRSAARSAAATF